VLFLTSTTPHSLFTPLAAHNWVITPRWCLRVCSPSSPNDSDRYRSPPQPMGSFIPPPSKLVTFLHPPAVSSVDDDPTRTFFLTKNSFWTFEDLFLTLSSPLVETTNLVKTFYRWTFFFLLLFMISSPYTGAHTRSGTGVLPTQNTRRLFTSAPRSPLLIKISLAP